MKEPIIDLHIHFGAPNDPQSGCYWSEEFEKTAAYYAMLLLTKSLFKKIDIDRVKKHLFGTIDDSESVDKSVLLALDEVYDPSRNKHKEWTHLYVSNQFLAGLVLENDRVLYGCSVHPFRPDWQEELDFNIEQGTVLCKWIPSSQLINPADSNLLPFYKKLSGHNLPLLCHAGPEYTIPTSNKSYDEFNNPKYLRLPLDNGVTVIIAHCALPYFWLLDTDYQDDFRDFLELFEEAEKKNWKLYADVSALTGPLRAPYIETILEIIPQERLVYGSDYPIPLFELSYNKCKNFFCWFWFIIKAILQKNPLDKNYFILKEMGFEDQVFTNAGKIFAKINRNTKLQ